MATYSRKLKDSSGNFVAPATRASCVYMSDNTVLENYLSTKLQELEDKIQSSVSLLSVYPVGAIYQSENNTSPASLFGGSWAQLQGRFLLGSSGAYPLTSMGGEEAHTLTISELADHYHSLATGTSGGSTSFPAWASPNAIGGPSSNFKANSALTGYISTVTKNQPHNNMPPYYAVNIWRRTA